METVVAFNTEVNKIQSFFNGLNELHAIYHRKHNDRNVIGPF